MKRGAVFESCAQRLKGPMNSAASMVPELSALEIRRSRDDNVNNVSTYFKYDKSTNHHSHGITRGVCNCRLIIIVDYTSSTM